MFKYYLYKIGQFLVNHIPQKISYKLAGIISDAHYFTSLKDKKAVRNNLENILHSKKDLSRLSREMFRNFGRYLVEFFQIERTVNKEYIKEKVKIKNIERINQVLDKGKGGLILSAHIGNWELGAVVLGALGYTLNAIALPHKERKVNNLFNHQRESKGIEVIPINKAAYRCIRALKNNELVAVLADRDFGSSGEILDFLGRKAIIPRGAAVFSEKTGAPVVPIFSIREKDNSFTLYICEPIFPPEPVKGMGKPEAVLKIMRQYTAVMEDIIRRYPSQWMMFRKFWV